MSAAKWPPPGHVKHHGGGALVIGSSPNSEALAQTLRAADIQTTVTDDIERVLWSKLVTNCAYNALSAVAGISYGPMLDIEGTRDVVASAVQEAITVARACGVLVPEDLLEKILKIPMAMPNQMSSTAQDLARGKPSEIDFLNGHVVRKGAELGIPTPTNRPPNGSYLSEAWAALFERADKATKNAWLNRIDQLAAFMLDGLDEIDRWLPDQQSEALFERLSSDVTPILLFKRLDDLQGAPSSLRDGAIAALKGLLKAAPPRLYGTYDHIVRECESLGLEDTELASLLEQERAKIFEARSKRNAEERHEEPLPDGWVAP